MKLLNWIWWNGPLARYGKLQVTHAPGMPGTFSPPQPVRDPDIYHGTFVMHVPWCMPGSLTSGIFWSRSRRMHNAQFYLSGKRSMVIFPRAYFKRNIISHCIVWPQNIYGHLNIQYKLLRNMMRCVYVSYSVSVWQQTWLQLKLNGIKTHLRTEMSTVDNTSLPVQQI